LAGIAEVAMIVLIAAAAHLALHAFLYGKPSLNGKRAPFLMARVIADGPGRFYLQQHCDDMKLMICRYLPDIPNDVNEFLWNLDGIWQRASPAARERFARRGGTIRSGHSEGISARGIIRLCHELPEPADDFWLVGLRPEPMGLGRLRESSSRRAGKLSQDASGTASSAR
jgi:hypothetical protein